MTKAEWCKKYRLMLLGLAVDGLTTVSNPERERKLRALNNLPNAITELMDTMYADLQENPNGTARDGKGHVLVVQQGKGSGDGRPGGQDGHQALQS